ncbi:putative interferon-induced GTP-binding protein Mx, partial [Leptodontidium sp. MPI-SDFR-AT-0119]
MSSGLIVDDPVSPGRSYRHRNGTHAAPTRSKKKNAFLHADDPKHLELLNTLLELQALDIESHFDLPQIIVCGSQSSGKSSVLEAITEIPFPRSENTCTRFVTKVTLRTHPKNIVEVRIEQAAGSQTSVPRFPPITNLENLSRELQDQFEKASSAILGAQQQTKFSRDILSITISGPDRPILQILDLPGLIYHDASDKKNIQL